MTIATGQTITAADVNGALRQFVELAGGENYDPSADATWEDWDLSAIVPAGTQYVLVGMTQSSMVIGARKNGSSLDRKSTNYQGMMLLTECDSNRVIEVYAQIATNGNFNILGYWKDMT